MAFAWRPSNNSRSGALRHRCARSSPLLTVLAAREPVASSHVRMKYPADRTSTEVCPQARTDNEPIWRFGQLDDRDIERLLLVGRTEREFGPTRNAELLEQ